MPACCRHPPLDLSRLYASQNGEAAPLSGFAGTMAVKVDADTATLTYQGADGMLQYCWTPPKSAADPPLGHWKLAATLASNSVPVTVSFAADVHLEWSQAATWQQSHLKAVLDGVECTSTYLIGDQPVTLRSIASLRGKSLAIEINCDRPFLAAFEAGSWSSESHRRFIPTIYYSGHVSYLDPEDLFVGVFLDWTASSASTHKGERAIYEPRTDGSRNLLRERVIYSAAWHYVETFPNVPNPPSPFREHLADKVILDIWGGSFDDIASKLTMLHSYGLDHCAAIVHDWQHSGYDNAFPGFTPADDRLGGDSGMKHLVSVARQLGYDIALHENYVDYYPNYEHFNENDISLDSNGNRVKAYRNGAKIQSFAVQPHATLPLARRESSQINDLYHPNADYLDVHSSAPPWFHVDFRASADGAATYRPVAEANRQLWAFERSLYGGPVFGEGANNWYWSGLLDGVEACLGAGWPTSGGRTVPLVVDFDLLKIHPLQFNHGMGYYERWWHAPMDTVPPMEVLDQYRMEEVIFGHAGFLGRGTFANLPLSWLEYNLMSPVTARYATALATNIQYQVDDRWVDSTEAAKAGIWNRVRVTYNNGLVVTANQATNLLREGDYLLPQFGWLAQGAGVTAWTALCQGSVADFAETADSTFANARPAVDWSQGRRNRSSDSAQANPVDNTHESHLNQTGKVVDSATCTRTAAYVCAVKEANGFCVPCRATAIFLLN